MAVHVTIVIGVTGAHYRFCVWRLLAHDKQNKLINTEMQSISLHLIVTNIVIIFTIHLECIYNDS